MPELATDIIYAGVGLALLYSGYRIFDLIPNYR